MEREAQIAGRQLANTGHRLAALNQICPPTGRIRSFAQRAALGQRAFICLDFVVERVSADVLNSFEWPYFPPDE